MGSLEAEVELLRREVDELEHEAAAAPIGEEEIGVTGATGGAGLEEEIGATGATGGAGLEEEIGATGATGGAGLEEEDLSGLTGATGGVEEEDVLGETGTTGATGGSEDEDEEYESADDLSDLEVFKSTGSHLLSSQ